MADIPGIEGVISGDRPASHVPQRTVVAQAISAVLVAGTAAAPLHAQELEEIVVTATKRAESVMDVPLAISAISGDFVRDVNLDDIKDLVAFSPGVTGNSKDSFIDTVRVRGIVTNDFGNGGDPSIGLYKNGFYQGRNGAGITSLFDVERAEVLRGPQGFLFGRNSISGAMNVHTTKPTLGQTDGYIDVRAGERGVIVGEGAVNATLGDKTGVRFAAYHAQEDGYIKNVADGTDLITHNRTAVRVTGLYESDNFDGTLYLEYEDRDQSGTVYRATGNAGSYALLESFYGDLGLPSGAREVNIDGTNMNIPGLPPGVQDNGKVFSAGLVLDWDTAIGTVTSLTGYKDHEYAYTEDFDAVNLLIFNYGQDQDGNYFEQEFRITSETDNPLSWYAGVSYYREEIDSRFVGQQDEDLYCTVYWSYYSGADSCQGVFDFYNTYYGGAYAYVLYDYFGTYTWEASPTGNMDDWNETRGRFQGWATYVDLNFRFNESWDASVGVRYNWDEKKMSQQVLTALNPSPVLGQRVQTGYSTPNGPLSDTRSWSKTTWRAVLNWHPNDDNLLFASATTGYKQGGFNSFSITPNAFWGVTQADPSTHVPASFNGEDSISYEIGWKGTLLEGRTQLTLNAFVYEYTDLQATCSTTTPVVIVCNVGEVDAHGVEGTAVSALGENTTFSFGFSYFDSEGRGVQEFCSAGERVFGTADACEGASLPGTPEWTFFVNLNGDYPVGNGSIFGNLSYSWEDEKRAGWLPLTPESTGNTTPPNGEGGRMVEGYSEGNFLVGYRGPNNWSAAVYVENFTDNVYSDGGNSGGNPANPYVQYDFGPGRPRTVGARFTYNF